MANNRYFHVSNGRAYGPSNEGESLKAYKARVRQAYGNLRGVTFGAKADLNAAYFY